MSKNIKKSTYVLEDPPDWQINWVRRNPLDIIESIANYIKLLVQTRRIKAREKLDRTKE